MEPKEVHKNNVVPILIDVKDPAVNYGWTSHHRVVDLRKSPMRPRAGFLFRAAKIGAMCAVVLSVGYLSMLGVRVWKMKDIAKESGVRIGRNFELSAEAIKNLKPDAAKAALDENAAEIGALGELVGGAGTGQIVKLLGSIFPAVRGSGELVERVARLNLGFASLAAQMGELQRNGFSWFQSDGKKLVAALSAARATLAAVNGEAEAIKNATGNLKQISEKFGAFDKMIGEKYVGGSAEISRTGDFLGALVSFLDAENPRHVLVMFQNPAEIRPAGGFLGSYADITVKGGQLGDIDVRDIYDPDGQLDVKFVPPYQLQTMSRDWGARDANWFFDFPTSAKTVVSMLETSKMYAEKNVKFDAAVAVNVDVLESVIAKVGPVELPEYGTAIDASNFLETVQREVEAGKDKKAGQPKKILKTLAPILVERVKGLDAAARAELAATVAAHVAAKDVMFWAKDEKLQSFANAAGADGAVAQLPAGFFGTYLAIVDANVAGGKTDAFVKQSASVTVNVDTAGGSLVDLAVSRAHAGGGEKDPWWNARNQNYVQIFSNPGSSVMSVSGNAVKKEKPNFDYAAADYVENPDLAAIDGSRVPLLDGNVWETSQFGKDAFGTWFNVEPKKAAVLDVRYAIAPAPGVAPAHGSRYTFMYEKQSGVDTDLTVNILAPLGFVWKETGTPSYAYADPDPRARVSIVLELQKAK